MKHYLGKSLKLAVVILLIVGILGACSSNKPTEQQSTNSDGDSEGLSGKLEIQYFVGGYGDAWWKQVIKDFKEKYPELEIVEHAGPNINEEMRTRWISNNPPDLVYIDGAGSSETKMVEDNQLMDLSQWAKDIKLEDGTALLDSFIVPPSQYNGKIYSLPLLFDTRGIWYDMAWFKKEGFETPNDYETWLDSMKEIKATKNISPLATTGVYPSVFMKGVLYPAIGAAGGDQLLSDIIKGVEGAWSSDNVLKVMEKVQEFQEEGLIDPGFAALTHTQAQMNFLLHDNAYVPVGFWLPKEMEKDIPEDFDFGMIPTPMNDPGEPMVVVPDIRTLAISKNAKNPEAAKEFLKFAFEKEYAVKFSELTGAMMNIKGVEMDSNPNIPEYLKNANKLINDPSKVVLRYIPHPMSADLEKPIGDALVALMLGDIDAKEFIKRAEKASEEYRKSLN
ncbi:ABC transporter substrate-binding protein [Neobacillus sp. 179-J 1A1 HS]|uniref:ABC transporter substrate-binding protein n=1 Tax=Neobacillus driksii TaxID=3035913 RepID=UPI0035BBF285